MTEKKGVDGGYHSHLRVTLLYLRSLSRRTIPTVPSFTLTDPTNQFRKLTYVGPQRVLDLNGYTKKISSDLSVLLSSFRYDILS